MLDQLTIDSIEPVQAVTGHSLKESGLDSIEGNNKAFMNQLRQYAKQHSRMYGEVSSDDLRDFAESLGLTPTHCNAWGGILRGKGWKVVGRKMSNIPTNHAREIRVYRWEGA